ncbi:MAG TPA: carbonic anhydrase [Gemmataceae bacterium]|jgi:carbonic anhydrase|nr:carbonic anhydrase [Gemmataceae bacterium]
MLILVGWAVAIAFGVISLVAWRHSGYPLTHVIPTDPEAVLAELRAGNARFVSSHRIFSADTKHDEVLRRQLAKGQHPFVGILCCADSRVCPEVIFDQPVGSFFEIRNAGNVMDDDTIASMEYAAEHLQVRFLCVLGHKGCGAIEAVHSAGAKPLHDHLKALQDRMRGIMPKVLASQDQHTPGHLAWLSLENAKEQAKSLLTESEPVRSAVSRGELCLMIGMYDMENGEVEFFDSPSNDR